MTRFPVSKISIRKSNVAVRTQHNGNGHRRDIGGQLQAILDTAVEGIIVIDDHGIITTFNRAAAKMFGYDLDEVLGCDVSMLMPHSTGGDHGQFIAGYLQTGRAKIIGNGREVVGLCKDGTTFPIELAVSEVRHDGRRSFTGIVRDISNRKRLEKAILDVSEREQRRIGKELHDGLCQELAGIAFLVKTMHHQLQVGEDVTEQAAADVAALLQQSVKHARALARGLQPVDLLPGGLSVALKHLAADTSDAFAIQCRFRCPRRVEIDDSAVATHLYRIAQECVRDAVHYAKATEIVISLSPKHGGIQLSVRYDATRVSSAGVFGGDMVHEMIHQRAHMIGAKIMIHQGKSGKVRITCQLPEFKAA